ncbi:MAG: HAD family phosphatase [Planctomycetia bacterium]|nr:HAD family phosphatase [Planctomycetia bacterium]
MTTGALPTLIPALTWRPCVQTLSYVKVCDMTIRFVYFDLGNVLLFFSAHRMFSQVAKALNVSEHDLQSILVDKEQYRQYALGRISTQEYFQFVCETLGVQGDLNDFLTAVNDIFWSNDPIFPILYKLAKHNFPRGVLSNTIDVHWKYIEEAYPRIWDLFPQHKLASCQVGALKPDREIYQIALDDARKEIPDLKPEEVLFIDDLIPNVEGARQFGFQAIHYVDFDSFLEQYKQTGLPTPSRYLMEPSEKTQTEENNTQNDSTKGENAQKKEESEK